jgi:hypothetical protein
MNSKPNKHLRFDKHGKAHLVGDPADRVFATPDLLDTIFSHMREDTGQGAYYHRAKAVRPGGCERCASQHVVTTFGSATSGRIASNFLGFDFSHVRGGEPRTVKKMFERLNRPECRVLLVSEWSPGVPREGR